MASSGDCTLYAELLANLGQISLAASLSSSSDASTQVSLSSDCRDVELQHRGIAYRLGLPAKSSLGGTLLPIQDKQKGTTALSWRLPLERRPALPTSENDCVPWSATDMEPGSAVVCRQCAIDVVPSGAVNAWKDLPSENWAEMMEFWHCHKPEHHNSQNHSHGHDHALEESGKADEKSLAARGYGASSAISAQDGVGFVDLPTLMFAETDCQNVTFSLSTVEQGSTDRQSLSHPDDPPPRNLNVFCSSCRAHLGFFHFRTSAVTLLKWQVTCHSTSNTLPTIPECLAATITATIARSGSSKSLITPLPETIHLQTTPRDDDDRSAIHIWVLNSSIAYSSSTTTAPSSNGSSNDAARGPTPAIKLLYKPLRAAEADRMLDVVACEAQEIGLPAPAVAEVLRHLEESNSLLPLGERTFKEWKVGLLTRWDGSV